MALMLLLADELASGRRDLQALAHRWVARHAADSADIDAETSAALAHLARHDAPPSQAAGLGSDPLVRAVPIALACHDAPRTLVSATYHVVALTHPHPLVAWAAVAMNVAVAGCVNGKRDVVPDVIEALRSNDVPEELLLAVRRVPLPRRAQVEEAAAAAGHAPADVVAALRLAYHEPLLERGLAEFAGAGPARAGRAGLVGALLGARDGAAAIPSAWTASVDRPILMGLAGRLVSRVPATA